MKLLNIQINNFRPFYGNQGIDFADTASKKVTVIHAENHTGKTNFVDAFRWVFYGKIQGEHPDQIVNHIALSEVNNNETAKGFITVKFEHENKIFEFHREVTEKKIDKDKSERVNENIKLHVIDSDGRSRKQLNPKATINKILPEALHQYFFLAGENIQDLGRIESKEKVQNAIKILMGLEVLDRGKRHLRGKVKNQLRDELALVAGSDEKLILEQLKKLEDERGNIDKRRNIIIENKKSIIENKNKIDEKLREAKNTRNLQQERDKLVAAKEDIESKMKQHKNDIMNRVSSDGFLAFINDAIIKSKEILDEKRQKGVLPASITHQYITDILERGKCICERELCEGSEAYTAVEKLRNPETKDEYVEAYNTLGLSASQLSLSYRNLRNDLVKDQTLLAQYLNDIGQIKEKLEEVDKQFDKKDYEKERDLIENKRKLESDMEKANQEIGRLERDIEELDKLIHEKNKEHDEVKAQNTKNKVAQLRLQTCEKVANFIDELHQSLIHRDRKMLWERMNKIFRGIIREREDATIELNDDFELSVRVLLPDGGSKQLPKSGAQMQITCLSFIASIVAIAKENMDGDRGSFKRGGLYPLVLDSPFGVMDPDYRKHVANQLPQFAEQIIILVAPQQWDKNIEEEMRDYIGKRYVFHHYKPLSGKTSTQEINGESYILSEYVDGRVRTEIKEVLS